MENEPIDLEDTMEIPIDDIEDTMEIIPIKEEEMSDDGSIL